MASANLASLTLFADRVVSHATSFVVGVVVPATVGAADGVGADRLAVLPGLLVDVVLGAFATLLVVVFLVVLASALAASDRASRVYFVPELPAACALNQVDLLRPSVHSALGVEESDGTLGELGYSFLLVVGDGERDVGGSLVVVWGGSWTACPVGAFHEDGVGEEGVCVAEFRLEIFLGDRDEGPVWCSSILITDTIGVGDPLPLGNVADDDSRPLDGFVEGGVGVGVTFADDAEDGGHGLLDLGVERVEGEVYLEVEERGPLGRVGSDVEAGAGAVDLRDDNLDRHGGASGWFVAFPDAEGVPFAVAAGASGLLFGGGSHELVDRDVLVLVHGWLFWSGGDGGERLFGGGDRPSGILGGTDFGRGERFLDRNGRRGVSDLLTFRFRSGDRSGGGGGAGQSVVGELDSSLCICSWWVDGLGTATIDLLPFVVYDFPVELFGPSGGDGDLSDGGVWELLGSPFAEVELGRSFDVF